MKIHQYVYTLTHTLTHPHRLTHTHTHSIHGYSFSFKEGEEWIFCWEQLNIVRSYQVVLRSQALGVPQQIQRYFDRVLREDGAVVE